MSQNELKIFFLEISIKNDAKKFFSSKIDQPTHSLYDSKEIFWLKNKRKFCFYEPVLEPNRLLNPI